MKANETRNQQIVELRDKDPKKYSFRELASMFRVDVSTVFEIYHREKAKKSKNAKRPAFMIKKYPNLAVGNHTHKTA